MGGPGFHCELSLGQCGPTAQALAQGQARRRTVPLRSFAARRWEQTRADEDADASAVFVLPLRVLPLGPAVLHAPLRRPTGGGLPRCFGAGVLESS